VTGLSPEKSRENSYLLRNLETAQKRALSENIVPN
jgi:hypothetical protein